MSIREFDRRLREALRPWAQAWRGRSDNPLARRAALTQARRAQRGSPWRCSWWLLSCGILISGATACLLAQAVLRFGALGSSGIASTAYAHNALLWSTLQVLDGAVLFGVAWLLERLAQAGWFCTLWLAQPGVGRPGIGEDYCASPLSTEDYAVGALAHALRLCLGPCIMLGVFGAANQLCAVIAQRQGTLAAPCPAWPGGELVWLCVGAGLSGLLRCAGSLAAVLATLLLLLALSPYWRNAAAAYLAPVTALAWHALAALSNPPGRRPWAADPSSDWLALVFAAPQAAWITGAGLVLLGLEAYIWRGPRTLALHARWGLGAARLLAACGGLCILWILIGRFINYDELYAHLSQTHTSMPDLRSLLPATLWPLSAISGAYSVPVLEQLAEVKDASALLLLKALGLRALALLIPLGLGIIFLGHLRTAIWLKRRGAL
jgi:hypothetical protein